MNGVTYGPTVAYSILGADSDDWYLNCTLQHAQLYDVATVLSPVSIHSCSVPGGYNLVLSGFTAPTNTWTYTAYGPSVPGTNYDSWEVSNNRLAIDVLKDPSQTITQSVIVAPAP